jgi:vancomycin resistance protein YoaR
MGLFDRSKRVEPASPEDWKRIGRLEAEVESLRLQWAGYRDELKRLVNRLEKRDQRAEAREKADLEQTVPEPQHDEITRQVLARRERHGLRRLQG